MSDKLLSGLLGGCKQQAGSGWSGTLYVYDWDEVNEASRVSQIYHRQIPAEQLYPQTTKDNKFVFPLADHELSQPGLKASEMSRRAIKRQRWQDEKEKEEEEHRKKLEKEQQIELAQKEEQDLQMKEDDFWLVNSEFINRVHKRSRRTLYVPTEEDCPVPLKYIDVMRFTKTSFAEKSRNQ